ncbi:hypothetical protein F1528_17715, partial [Yersinia pestis]
RRRKYIHVGSSRAILGADALLLCLSSPFKIASSGFVSSLNDDVFSSNSHHRRNAIIRRLKNK